MIFVDIDECETEKRCPETCLNTHGGYHCACPAGYSYDGIYNDCKGIYSSL